MIFYDHRIQEDMLSDLTKVRICWFNIKKKINKNIAHGFKINITEFSLVNVIS